jgi:hypothetical protein
MPNEIRDVRDYFTQRFGSEPVSDIPAGLRTRVDGGAMVLDGVALLADLDAIWGRLNALAAIYGFNMWRGVWQLHVENCRFHLAVVSEPDNGLLAVDDQGVTNKLWLRDIRARMQHGAKLVGERVLVRWDEAFDAAEKEPGNAEEIKAFYEAVKTLNPKTGREIMDRLHDAEVTKDPWLWPSPPTLDAHLNPPPPWGDLSDGDLLQAMGTDAEKWAAAFKTINRLRVLDEDLLTGWFANAIEAGREAGRQAHPAEPPPVSIIRTEADYDAAHAEFMSYFDGEPAPGTPAADRFELLGLVLAKYEGLAPPPPVRGYNPSTDTYEAVTQAWWDQTVADLRKYRGIVNRVEDALGRPE